MRERHSCSVNRACRLASIDRKTYSYQSKGVQMTTEICQLLSELAKEHPRYGFKKLFEMIRLKGYCWNHKRVYRHYIGLKLNLKRKPKKRLAPRTAEQLTQPPRLNVCWSLDFMSDALTSGKRFRTLNILDDCNREGIGIFAALSLPATAVTQWLDEIAMWRGYPLKIRVDNGPENIAQHFKNWAKSHNVAVHYIQPGKPAQNGYIERFNRSYREEVLDMYLFENLTQVQQLTDKWLVHYNENRPHESLGNLPPTQFAKQLKWENSTSALG